MSDRVNMTPSKDFEIFRGAPLPIAIRNRVNGVLRAFQATLQMTLKPKTGNIILTVGSGITLSVDEGVANARATILLTNAQSLLVPEGSKCAYEITEGAAGNRVVVMAGTLVGSVQPAK